MFKSQGQGVNPCVWAVTLPCSEATAVGTQRGHGGTALCQERGGSALDRPLGCLFPIQGGVLVLLGLGRAGGPGDGGSGADQLLAEPWELLQGRTSWNLAMCHMNLS